MSQIASGSNHHSCDSPRANEDYETLDDQLSQNCVDYGDFDLGFVRDDSEDSDSVNSASSSDCDEEEIVITDENIDLFDGKPNEEDVPVDLELMMEKEQDDSIYCQPCGSLRYDPDYHRNMSTLMQDYNRIPYKDSTDSLSNAEKQPFNPMSKSESAPSLAVFCSAYASHTARTGMTEYQSTETLKFMKTMLPEILWPLTKARRPKLDLAKYEARRNARNLTYDACPRGCAIYIGPNRYLINCPNKLCRNPRYQVCKKCTNPNCNPFNRGHSRRIAFRKIHYFPLMPLLKEIVYKSVNKPEKFNVFHMNDDDKMYRSQMYHSDHQKGSKPELLVSDITESLQYKHHKAEMKANYEHACQMYPLLNLEDWSFPMTVFYDGGTLHKRQSKSIWPLVIQLLNCHAPPRMKIGIGMHQICVHDLKVGCRAEQGIFNTMFVPELNVLGNGIIFSFFTDDDNQEHFIFLQARLICHAYDTMALLKVCKFPGEYSTIFFDTLLWSSDLIC